MAGPEPVDPATAAAASERFAWQHDHPFPTCFGCGPERDPADALCLFCGPVGDGRFAVPWTPPAWTGDARGRPAVRLGGARLPQLGAGARHDRGPVVLGRFTVALEGPIAVGAPHVIQSWLEREDGRKRHTAVALFTAGGERRACGRAVWVELARPLGA